MPNERGFSLIEALIAMGILAVGITAMVGTTGTIMNKNQESRKSSIAMTLAQDKIEYFKNTARTMSLSGANGLASPDLVASVWTLDADGETIDAQGNVTVIGPYNRTWTISTLAGENFLFDVLITMTWQDSSGTRTLQLNTEVTQ